MNYTSFSKGDIMNTGNLFYNLTQDEYEELMNHAETKKISYKKEQIIITNVQRTSKIGFILDGEARIVSFDYNGNKTLLEELEKNDVFGSIFSYLTENVLEVVAKTDCTVIFFDYQFLLTINKIAENMLYILSNKVLALNERIDILTKKTIRERILLYFALLSAKQNSKYFSIPFTYTELSEYIGSNRSATMREIKNLKDEGFIETDGTKVKLLY